MPSVEMRTTRVFGARVLRSGRRCLTTEEVFKHMRRAPLAAANAEGDWIEMLDHGGGGGGVEFIGDGESQKEIKLRQTRGIGPIKLVDDDDEHDHSLTDNTRWGLVYSRKRVRTESTNCSDLDKKFGKKFSRKQSGKNVVTEVRPPSVLQLNITTTKPRLSSKSKSKKKKVTRVSVTRPICLGLPCLSPRNSVTIQPCLSPRNSITVNHTIQKKRSSLRLRKLKIPSSFGNSKSTSAPFFPISSKPVISKPIQKASFKEELKELTENIDSASCNASILVIESDRGHRELGAVITMEMVGPNQWNLVVKRNGVERFRIDALNVMRPCFCNRITLAIIWASSDESWRLEFPNRQDWFIFKELYRECSERTVSVQSSLASIIPVPRVKIVSEYADEKFVPFKMPDLYISTRGDEVSRTLKKIAPVYDMDSDDDEWLSKFNDGRDTRVDEDVFEKIIDAFEKGVYCYPDDYSDVTMVVDRCLSLASKDVLKSVYGYWIAKRKTHSALVWVFKLYKPKRHEPLNLKSVLRKKRSFRQRGTQAGRGKELTFLKAALFENTRTVEAENTATKVEETEAAAIWAEQMAVMKRERAQLLMKVADILTYKAAIAMKITDSQATFNDDNIDELFLTGE
ncbi:uncharacterized protein LOC143630329 [Bidens hawaiensis]|uniref:uncharacterized protein LOC143630329 n=1 Tax=Bidens hawaiensis TaxID=980011 RepID=UPI00404B8A9B